MHNPSEWGCGKYFCAAHQWNHDCPYPPEDEEPCEDGKHQWVGQQMGGPPDAAESYEWVCYCKACGIEHSGE
jgi:hypothetical protein